jgi:four helix bundle protein
MGIKAGRSRLKAESFQKTEMIFAFEKLDVWHKAVAFADKVISIVEEMDTDRKHYRLIEQLESCASSPAMNIAEGKGRHSKKEFIQFLYIARGSLYETITLLTIFKGRNWIKQNQFYEISDMAKEVASMLMGLVRSLQK